MRTFILPTTDPHPSLDYHAFCECASETSGNFYDFIPQAGSRLAISFGNLPPAGEIPAISISGIQAIVRGLTAGSRGDLASLAVELNRTLYLLGPQYLCAPWFYAVADPVRHTLDYVNAGHEPALLIRAGGRAVERLERTGATLGLSVRGMPRQKTIALDPGDLLAIFSEGLSESAVLDVIHRNPHIGTTGLALRIWEAARCSPGEDCTFAAVRVLGACRRPFEDECALEMNAVCAA